MSSQIARQYENYSIYVILSLRGANPGFHWGIFCPTATPTGQVWHAINRSGGWSLELKETSGVPTSMSLCLAFKVGTVNSANWETFKQTLASVPANGQPSPNTNEEFTCRVWVKDALHALHLAGVIRLLKSIAEIELEALDKAEANRLAVERGRNSARVINQTGYSTSS
ncbi:hypothetical protein EJ08DRAFT_594316 [Tothia fuscella]|uniref:Uncharacterized protein n=1 Tax=Tothia fuscella TaxID=1048955 RepID=A0A9P4TVA8_9PEZI|nr:hypothetical protein EJ08DRAFT_594316 [Tothia fuscella]